jgi:putative proteasome-type protease
MQIGRPILDRGIETSTSLEVAAKYALLSMDATMRSNVTVGPPIDLLLYRKDSFEIDRYRRLQAADTDLNYIHAAWEQALRRAVEQLPKINFEDDAPSATAPPESYTANLERDLSSK